MTKAFDRIAREAHEIWTSSPRRHDNSASAEALRYLPLADHSKLNFHIIDVQASCPSEFRINTLIERTDQQRNGATTFGEHPDQGYIREKVAPVYDSARDSREPITDLVQAGAGTKFYVYDRLILPQRVKSGRSAWAIGIVLPRLILPLAPAQPELTPREEAVLDHLLLGLPPKDIARKLNLSQRTVEHRIVDLRSKFGANSVTHLVALATANALAEKNTS
ncbi:response regulator transcription factor [Roseibium sp.]|uniref:response regulator transcription factor n=1 Tax=Roseibium sp. TaxID=1936156 RepID=UPI003A977554